MNYGKQQIPTNMLSEVYRSFNEERVKSIKSVIKLSTA